jgi:hypothetical protein
MFDSMCSNSNATGWDVRSFCVFRGETKAMNGLQDRSVWVVVCLAAIMTCSDAKAQATAATGTSSSGGTGMGMGFMPMTFGMFGSATPSATDAAALGMAGPSNNAMGFGVGLNGQSSNIFTNPMAGAVLSSGAYPTSQRQMGLMMLAGQSQMLGIGSGQLSGVRPGPSRGNSALKAAPKSRGTSNQPGGMAARYFNRAARVTPHPQSFYNRQSVYFPQVAR